MGWRVGEGDRETRINQSGWDKWTLWSGWQPVRDIDWLCIWWFGIFRGRLCAMRPLRSCQCKCAVNLASCRHCCEAWIGRRNALPLLDLSSHVKSLHTSTVGLRRLAFFLHGRYTGRQYERCYSIPLFYPSPILPSFLPSFLPSYTLAKSPFDKKLNKKKNSFVIICCWCCNDETRAGCVVIAPRFNLPFGSIWNGRLL